MRVPRPPPAGRVRAHDPHRPQPLPPAPRAGAGATASPNPDAVPITVPPLPPLPLGGQPRSARGRPPALAQISPDLAARSRFGPADEGPDRGRPSPALESCLPSPHGVTDKQPPNPRRRGQEAAKLMGPRRCRAAASETPRSGPARTRMGRNPRGEAAGRR